MSANPTESKIPKRLDQPKQAAKGPKIARRVMLRKALSTAFSGAVGTFSYAKIEQTFSDLASAHPNDFKEIYDEAVVEWKDNFNDETKVIFEKHDLDNKLAKIDRCIQRQTPISKFSDNPFINPKSEKRARELMELNPAAVLRAAKIDALKNEVFDMKNKRLKIEGENEKLYKEVTKTKADLAAKAGSFKTYFSEILNVANMLASREFQSLMDSTASLSTENISPNKN